MTLDELVAQAVGSGDGAPLDIVQRPYQPLPMQAQDPRMLPETAPQMPEQGGFQGWLDSFAQSLAGQQMGPARGFGANLLKGMAGGFSGTRVNAMDRRERLNEAMRVEARRRDLFNQKSQEEFNRSRIDTLKDLSKSKREWSLEQRLAAAKPTAEQEAFGRTRGEIAARRAAGLPAERPSGVNVNLGEPRMNMTVLDNIYQSNRQTILDQVKALRTLQTDLSAQMTLKRTMGGDKAKADAYLANIPAQMDSLQQELRKNDEWYQQQAGGVIPGGTKFAMPGVQPAVAPTPAAPGVPPAVRPARRGRPVATTGIKETPWSNPRVPAAASSTARGGGDKIIAWRQQFPDATVEDLDQTLAEMGAPAFQKASGLDRAAIARLRASLPSARQPLPQGPLPPWATQGMPSWGNVRGQGQPPMGPQPVFSDQTGAPWMR